MSLIERAVNSLGRDNLRPVARSSEAPAEVALSDAPAARLRERPEEPSVESAMRAAANIGLETRDHDLPADPPVLRTPGNPDPSIHIKLDILRRRGFVVPDSQTTSTSEEFRVIKRPLIANAFGKGPAPIKNGRRVMVTSAFPGEGKSFCAINLALSIAAERDHRVLLVDADVARPSIPRELGFTAGPGLMDWISDPNKHQIEDLVMPTDVEKLAILPSGRRHDHATELLASESMARFLDLLSAKFPDRLIIFDSPPLLVTTESRVLATYMGQIVLVVEAGRTPKAAVTEAIQTIEGASDVLGVVLNKSTGSHTGGYGYYGYGYGYGRANKTSGV